MTNLAFTSLEEHKNVEMELSLEESRIFRHLHSNDMNAIHLYCKHREYVDVATPEGNILRCIRCCRWWFPREPYPPPYGNPSLERFLRPCEHTRTRTLEGTTTMNKCLECDSVFPKNTAAVVWKNMRERTGDFIGMVGGLFQGRRLLGGDDSGGGNGSGRGGGDGTKNSSVKTTKGGVIKYSPPSGATMRPLTSTPRHSPSLPPTSSPPPPRDGGKEGGRIGGGRDGGGGGSGGIGIGAHSRSRVNSTPTPTSTTAPVSKTPPSTGKSMTNSMSPQMLPGPAITLPEEVVREAFLNPEDVTRENRRIVVTEDDEVF